jgi:hypothetical protein
MKVMAKKAIQALSGLRLKWTEVNVYLYLAKKEHVKK